MGCGRMIMFMVSGPEPPEVRLFTKLLKQKNSPSANQQKEQKTKKQIKESESRTLYQNSKEEK
jgi:hypothetical protein